MKGTLIAGALVWMTAMRRRRLWRITRSLRSSITSKPIDARGTLTKMEWINPHGWIHVEVKGPDGKVVSWAVETGAPNSLLRRGLRKTDFPIGVEVKVTGYLAKSGKPIVNGRTITFPTAGTFSSARPVPAHRTTAPIRASADGRRKRSDGHESSIGNHRAGGGRSWRGGHRACQRHRPLGAGDPGTCRGRHDRGGPA